jgi:hypothetical protein
VSGCGSQLTTATSPTSSSTSTPVTAGSNRTQRSETNNNICNHNVSPSSSYTSSPGSSELPKSSCSSCSSGKDQERSTLSNGVGRHESMWWETTHSNMRKRVVRADGAIDRRSERMSYITPPSLSLPTHSHYNLVSLSPLSSPNQPYLTYAKGDDTVYSRVGGSHVESRLISLSGAVMVPFSTTLDVAQ